MSRNDSDLRVRPGRIRDGGRGAARPKSFVGQVMRETRGKANPGLVNQLLTVELEKLRS